MAEEIASENGRISNFEGLVALTLDRVTLHTAMRHSSTSTYTPNIIQIKETYCGRMYIHTYVRDSTYICSYVRTYVWMDGHLRPALLGRLCRRVDLNVLQHNINTKRLQPGLVASYNHLPCNEQTVVSARMLSMADEEFW